MTDPGEDMLTSFINVTNSTSSEDYNEDDEFFKYEWWQYFIIPWIAGLVGYLTNVLALEMTFYPIEFTGLLLFRIKTEPWGMFCFVLLCFALLCFALLWMCLLLYFFPASRFQSMCRCHCQLFFLFSLTLLLL
jgi:hypothetical protein